MGNTATTVIELSQQDLEIVIQAVDTAQVRVQDAAVVLNLKDRLTVALKSIGGTTEIEPDIGTPAPTQEPSAQK